MGLHRHPCHRLLLLGFRTDNRVEYFSAVSMDVSEEHVNSIFRVE
jgi:hypothetical protein